MRISAIKVRELVAKMRLAEEHLGGVECPDPACDGFWHLANPRCCGYSGQHSGCSSICFCPGCKARHPQIREALTAFGTVYYPQDDDSAAPRDRLGVT
jgi:hypothetical protein